MKNRKVKAFIALLMAGVMAAGMMGCGGGFPEAVRSICRRRFRRQYRHHLGHRF